MGMCGGGGGVGASGAVGSERGGGHGDPFEIGGSHGGRTVCVVCNASHCHLANNTI